MPTPAHATSGINPQINFQGRLLTASGAVVPDGSYNLEFKIYQDGPGNLAGDTGGTLKWTEDWVYGTGSPDNRVVVRSGYFSVNLGSITSLSSVDFTQNTLWLSMNIGNTSTAASFAAASGDGEMLPMKRLTTNPYAYYAQNAGTLQGLAASAFAQVGSANTYTATNTFQNASGNAVLTIDASASTVTIGKSGPTGGVDGKLVVANATNANTLTLLSGATSSSYSLTLPTAGTNGSQCLQSTSGSTTTSTALQFGSCGANTLQDAYNNFGASSAVITLGNASGKPGALTIRDASTALGTNLLQVQNNAGSTTYFGVSANGITVQNASGYNSFAFDSPTKTLKVYENVANPTNYASVSYSGGAAVFAASSGTTQIGNGGSVSANLTGATDTYSFGTTYTPSASYSQSNFNVTRALTGGANSVGGNLLSLVDNSTTTSGGTVNPTLLLINQAASGTGSVSGNLIDAQLAGSSKFKVTTGGNVTAAGSLTVTGLASCTSLQTSGAGLFSCGTGGSGYITALGQIDGNSTTPNANGATVSSGTLYLNSASASFGGVVNTLAQTFAGTKTFNGGLVVAASQSLTLTGGITSTRPTCSASGNAGTLYFDTTTNELLQCQWNATTSTAKWVSAPRSSTLIVAASNSTQAEKDAADYVATGTSDQTTINSALTALPSGGGSVYLMEGTYTLSAAISVPNNTTLSGAGASTIITVPNAQNGSYNMITNTDTSTGTHVTIQNLLIDGNKANQTSGAMYGIYLNNMGGGSGSSARDGAKVTGITVRNIYGGPAVYLTNSSNNTISGITAQGNGTYGIYFTGTSSNNTITGNTIQGNSNNGMYLSGSTYNTITGNTVQGNSGHGIYLATSSNNTVSGNTLVSNTATGIYLYNGASGNIVSGNNVQGGSNGISMDTNSNYNTITGNTVQGTSNRGINGNIASYNTITGNTVQNNTSGGIYIYAGGNMTVTGNTVMNSNYGIFMQNSSGSVSGNSLQTNTNGIFLSGSGVAVSGNRIYDSGSSTTNNAIDLSGSSNSTITDNIITDSSCTTNCYAISIDSTSSNNYLSNNRYTGSAANPATINDLGTGTIYANQQDSSGTLINKSLGGGFTVGASSAAASLTLQGGASVAGLPVPTLSATVSNAGTAGTTTYRYQVTALDGTGETTGSTIQQTTTGNATLSTSNYNTITWTPVGGAIQYNIYRCTGTGCTPAKLSTVAGSVSSYSDQAAGSPSGAVPTTNTTGQLLLGTASTSNAQIVMANSSNANTVSLVSGATSASYSLTLPTAGVAGNSCLQSTPGSTATATALQWGSCGSGGSVSLAAVDSAGTANANGATLTGSVLNLNSASASFAGVVNTTAQTFAGTKTFNNSLTVSTADSVAVQVNQTNTANSILNLQSAGSSVVTVGGTGNVGINQLLGVGTGANGAAQLFIQPQGTLAVGEIIKQYPGSSASLFQLQDNNGNIGASFSAAGNQLSLGRVATSGTVNQGKLLFSDGTLDGFGLTLQSGTLTANRTITLPNSTAATDTVCLVTLGNCGGGGGGGTLQTDYAAGTGGTTPQIAVSTVKGALTVQNSATNSISGNLLTVNAAAANDTTLGKALLAVNTSGTTTLQGASTANDAATLGSELFTGTFNAASGWSGISGSGQTATATHTSGGGTTAITTTYTPTAGAFYQVTFQLAGNSTATNTVTVGLGADTAPAIGQTGTNTQTVVLNPSTTAALSFTPTTSFNGTISNISVKLITTSISTLTVLDSTAQSGLEVRVNNSNDNLFMGANSGISTTTGHDNLGIGKDTLQYNTTGLWNAALGPYALRANTTGYDNMAIGAWSLFNNTSGYYNTATGYQSLQSNTSGYQNTATGTQALQNSTTGIQNVAVGYQAGTAVTTGSGNVLLGVSSGANLTTGSNNVIIGAGINAPAAGTNYQLDIGDTLYGDMTSGQKNLAVGVNSFYGKLTVAGSVALQEITAPTATTGYGKLYVSSSDHSLHFVNASGTDTALGSGGGGGGSTHTKTITLTPEFPGAVFSPSGTSNTGYMSSSYVSGLTSGQGYKHNYYNWDTDQSTAQTYDIVTQYQIPSDWGTGFVSGSWKLWSYVTDTTKNGGTFMIKDVDGTSCYTSAQSVTPSSNTTWQQIGIADPGNGCTFAAGDIITIDIQLSANTATTNVTRIGELQFNYNTAY